MPYRSTIHHRLPGHRPSPVPPAANDVRAYRLGKCEMLETIGCFLAGDDCTLAALRCQIEDRLAELSAPATAATPADRQRRLGQAGACRACLDFIADRRSSRATLAVHIVCLLITTWPPDYREYRRRCKTGSVEDPALPERPNCLTLCAWYAAVDALHAEIARTQRAGLPPSQNQMRLETLLLRTPGEPIPHAE